MRRLFVIAAALLLAACGKGLDRKLVTGEGMERYRASLGVALQEMSDDENSAFNWAVSDFDLERLHSQYANASLRQIVRGEVKAGLAQWPTQLAAAEQQRAQFDPIVDELRQVKCEETEFSLPRNFHGLQPTIQAVLANGSKYGISSLKWRASLFLDGGKEPVAVAELHDNYNNSSAGRSLLGSARPSAIEAGGMKPGFRYTRKFTVGFVKGDENWTTLAVQNANRREVTLEPVLESIADYNDRRYLDGAPYEAIQNLTKSIEAAQRYAQY